MNDAALPNAELPTTWVLHALGDLGSWCGGGTPSKSEARYWQNGTVPWVSPKDMKRRRISQSQDYITEEALQASAARVVPSRSILVVTRSGILEHTLPVAITAVAVAINQDLKALIPRDDILAEFAFYAFKWAEKSILHTCSKSGTTVASISFGQLLEFRIPVPPLDEQRRIVEVIEEQFSRLDAAEASLARARKALERIRRSTLRIRGAHDSPMRPLGELVQSYDGMRVPVKASDRAERSGRYPYYGASGIIDHVDAFLFDGNYLLIAEDGANLLTRSKPIAFEASGKFWVNNHAHVIRTLPSLDQQFCKLVLNGTDLRPFVTGSAQPKMTKAAMNRIPIPLLPLDEQRRIVAKAEGEMSIYENVMAESAKALLRSKGLRQAILAAAFSGCLSGRKVSNTEACAAISGSLAMKTKRRENGSTTLVLERPQL